MESRHGRRKIARLVLSAGITCLMLAAFAFPLTASAQTPETLDSPTTAADADNRLEVFAIGFDSAIWHNYQTAQGGAWSGWFSFGAPAGTAFFNRPTVVANADGRLELFEVANGTLWHIWQVAPNSSWSSWQSLGGALRSTQIVAVARNADGRLEVFAVSGDDLAMHKWQLSNGWSSWALLGRAVQPVFGSLAAGLNLDGTLQVVHFNSAGVVWTIRQVTDGWSGWSQAGLIGPSDLPVIGHDQDGRLEVFARTTDSHMIQMYQVFRSSGLQWSPWLDMGGTFRTHPAVVSNADGRIEIFAENTSSSVGAQHNWQVQPNSSWSGWASLGTGSGFDLDIAAGRNGDGRLEVFATDVGVMWHIWQMQAGGAWSNWMRM